MVYISVVSSVAVSVDWHTPPRIRRKVQDTLFSRYFYPDHFASPMIQGLLSVKITVCPKAPKPEKGDTGAQFRHDKPLYSTV